MLVFKNSKILRGKDSPGVFEEEEVPAMCLHFHKEATEHGYPAVRAPTCARRGDQQLVPKLTTSGRPRRAAQKWLPVQRDRVVKGLIHHTLKFHV